jgi:drug/metabolite transporter (DMT)-like permease
MVKNISYLYVSLAALLWGSAFAVGKLLLAGLDNLQVLFFDNLFAFVGLFFIVLLQKKKRIIKAYTKQDYFTFAWMGFLGTFLYGFFLYEGLALLSAQEASILNYLWPVMVVIFATLILRENITLRKIFAIACSFFGIAIVVSKGDFSALQFGNLLGVLSAVAGAAAYGLFSVLGKKQNYEGFTSMMFFYFFGALFSLFAVLLFSSIPHLSLYQLAGLLWLGIFISGLGYVCWFAALKHGDTVKMSNMIFLTPFLSLVYIHFLTGEHILVSSIIGLVCIVAGILISSV